MLFDFLDKLSADLEPYLSKIFKIASVIIIIMALLNGFLIASRTSSVFTFISFITVFAKGVLISFLFLVMGVVIEKVFEIHQLLIEEQTMKETLKKEADSSNYEE